MQFLFRPHVVPLRGVLRDNGDCLTDWLICLVTAMNSLSRAIEAPTQLLGACSQWASSRKKDAAWDSELQPNVSSPPQTF